VFLLSLPVQASSLQYSGSTGTEGFPGGYSDPFFELVNAHSGDKVLINKTVGPDSTHVAAIVGEATFGRLSVYSHVGGSAIPGVPDAFYSAGLGVQFTDTVTVHGASIGLLSLDIYFHGDLDKSQTPDSLVRANFGVRSWYADGAITTANAGVGASWINSNPASKNPQPTSGLELELWNASSLLASSNGGYIFQGQASLLIPFYVDTFDVSIALSTSGFCHLPCSFTGDFAHTALVGGARILDSAGTVIPGASLTAQSGFDYQAAISPGSTTPGAPAPETPEPATAALTAGALGFFVWRYRRNILS
jgi:hypothetical protein